MECPGAEAAAGAPCAINDPVVARFDPVVPREVVSPLQAQQSLEYAYGTPLQAHQSLEYNYGVKAGESLGDRAERLLCSLADFTGTRLASELSLPVDFKISLQVVEYMGQQATLLHEVNTKMEEMRSEIFEHMCSVKDDLLDKHEEMAKDVKDVGIGMESLAVLCRCLKDDRDKLLKSSEEVRTVPPNLPTQQQTRAAEQQGAAIKVEPCTPNRNGAVCANIIGNEQRPVPAAKQISLPQVDQVEEYSYNREHCQHHMKEEHDAIENLDLEVSNLLNIDIDAEKQVRPSQATSNIDASGSQPQQFESKSSWIRETADDHWLRMIISHPYFEWACAIVIITNAVTIGIQAQESIMWAVENPGKQELQKSDVIAIMNKIYITFYTLELLSKLCVFRCNFFCGANWRWNLFDFILVLTGIYDIVTEITPLSIGGGMNVTGLRVLRIVKTLKLLRVIRVMRFFQVLRLMVSSIAGSMTILFWSILMISIMMYMFGLCFLQAVTGFLNDNKAADIDPGVMEGVVMYWSSVEQSMMSLFWAVTGGADWEPLANPIRRADTFFFCLFFFYIAFAAFAVLNVLTGMFVDAAMKVAQQDEENVVDELVTRPEVEAFRNYVNEKTNGQGCMTWELAQPHNIDLPKVMFVKLLEIEHDDCKRVYESMDSEKKGRVDLEEFIKACCHCKGSISGLDMVFLMTETKHINKQMEMSMEYIEKCFNSVLEMQGSKAPSWEHMIEMHRQLAPSGHSMGFL